MIAAVFHGPEIGHRVETVPDPIPAPRQVVLRVDRSGVCGSDLAMTSRRDTPTLLGAHFEAAFGAGAVLGHEICGTVIEVGSEVDRLKSGDRIAPMFFSGCGSCASCLAGTPQLCLGAAWFMGGYAQFALAHQDFSIAVPPELSAADGALIEPLATSLRTVLAAGVTVGHRVLVLGAGTLGLGAVYFARALGATRVMAAARTTARAAAAHQIGADHLVTTTGSDLAAEATELLGGPPDVVIETAGAIGLVDTAILTVRPGGTVLVAGLCLDPEPTSHAIAAMKNLTIRYSTAYTLRDFEVVTEMMKSGRHPRPELPMNVVSLEEFPRAFEGLRSPGTAAKVVLDPWRA